MKNLNSIFRIALLVISSLLSLNAQGWEKTFQHASNGLSKAFDVVEATDGGYVMCGEVDLPTGAIRHYIWLIKTDTIGNELWSHVYNYNSIGMEEGRALVNTPDGGFMIAGSNLDGNAQILKVDAEGDSLWTKNYGTGNRQRAEALIANPTTNGYLLVGSMETTPDIDQFSFWVVGLDAEGDTLWSKTYTDVEALGTRAMDVMPTADGHFLVVGTYGSGQIALLKIDAQGNQQWLKVQGFSTGDAGLAVHEMSNGDILVGGYLTGFAGYGPVLLQLDSDGEELDQILVDVINYGAVSDIQATTDGGFIITGSGFSFWENVDTEKGFLRKLDANLETEWDFFLEDNAQGTAVRQASDGSIIMSGYQGADMLLKKVNGMLTSNENILLGNQFTAEVYPNPVVKKLIIELPEEALSRSLTLRIYDMNGRIIQAISIDEGIEIIDVSALSSGLYSYVIAEKGMALKTGKLVVD